ncbi:MAG: hypothetical protein ABI670_09070 [Chloroflexota bacterium]
MVAQSQDSDQSALETAQTVVNSYWRAVDERNYTAAYEILSSSYKAQVTFEQFSKQLSETVAHASGVQFKDGTQLADGTIRLAVQVSIELGAVPGSYNRGNNVRFFILVEESGVWRIAVIATSP